jgi:hypothetical protein
MAQLTPRQQAARARIEALIRIVQPGLDLILATGDRISRTVQRSELDAALVRPLTADTGRGHALPPATPPAE